VFLNPVWVDHIWLRNPHQQGLVSYSLHETMHMVEDYPETGEFSFINKSANLLLIDRLSRGLPYSAVGTFWDMSAEDVPLSIEDFFFIYGAARLPPRDPSDSDSYEIMRSDSDDSS
jgi:hypothetical protein